MSGLDTHVGIKHVMIFLQDLSLFCFLLHTLLARHPLRAQSSCIWGSVPSTVPGPYCRAPVPPHPPPPPLTPTFRQVRCSALLSSFLPITRIDCSLPITLTQALMTSRLNYSTPLLAAFLASQIYAA